jgi:error-prone DNA polymerase
MAAVTGAAPVRVRATHASPSSATATPEFAAAVLPSPAHGRGAGGEGFSRAEARPLVHHYPDPLAAPRLDPALLEHHAVGLILLTGCRQGQLSRLIDAGRFDEAEAVLRRYVAWFGPDNVAVELQHNRVFGDERRIARLVALAERVGVPYVATGNVHYHRRERHRLQDVLVAIRHRTTLDACHRQRRPNAEFHLRSPAEVAALFARYPAALTTSLTIAERCAAFDLSEDLGYRFPDYPTDRGETPDDVLARVCRRELAGRYPPGSPRRAAAEDRLAEELGLIRHHGLAGFFLIHRDLLVLAQEVAVEVRGTDSARARAKLPPGRGRGSSVSSIVCYLIGLSPVDPLTHKLSLGRFLNEEIRSVPDIDLDFPRDIREQLIARIHRDYGERAALVCAFATYKLRSAVRDVGKALGLPPADLDRIAKLSEPRSAKALDEELARIPAYAARKDTPPWSYLVELARELAGFPRHVTQHVGGMIVASHPITELVPVQPAAMEGRYLCQWDKDSCDDARFVKIDFLALGMLSLVEECMELIAAGGKAVPDLSQLDFEDKEVFEMIRAGDTIGTFQIESRAQIQTLLKTQPETLDDLVVQVAIVRPGPIVGGATTPYVRSRQVPWFTPTYDHPLLIPVLEETRGVILYQEQVVDVAVALAGFTPGQADALRRAMTRKRSREAMVALWVQFRDGALAKDVELEVAKTVFRKLLGFSNYGFPKAHAASFAVLAYQSCWLKLKHPAEFLCALLNNQPMGFYPSHVLVNDGKRHGLRILPPDVNLSGVRCAVEDGNAIRIGLGYVKGLGETPAEAIVRERTANGPFRSLADFVRRVPASGAPRSEATENLIAVGAFDGFGLGRREALWQLGLFIPARGFGGARAKAETTPGRQVPLPLPVEQDTVELPPMPARKQMLADYEVLGLSPRYHPLGLLREGLPQEWVTTTGLESLPDGTPVRLAGLVVCRQRPETAKGITFLLLEDELGLANAIVYPALYEAQRPLVRAEPFLVVTGRLQRQDRTINVLVEELARLEDAYRTFTPVLRADEPEHAELDREDLRTLSPVAHSYR